MSPFTAMLDVQTMPQIQENTSTKLTTIFTHMSDSLVRLYFVNRFLESFLQVRCSTPGFISIPNSKIWKNRNTCFFKAKSFFCLLLLDYELNKNISGLLLKKCCNMSALYNLSQRRFIWISVFIQAKSLNLGRTLKVLCCIKKATN